MHDTCTHGGTFAELRECLLGQMRSLGPAGEAWADQSSRYLDDVLRRVENRPPAPPAPSITRRP